MLFNDGEIIYGTASCDRCRVDRRADTLKAANKPIRHKGRN
jgi:hypothetical protein